MKKTIIIISILIILAIIAGGFWYAKNQNKKTIIPAKVGIQNENETVSKNDQDVEESKIEPNFGIDDFGLKYNKGGSVDVSGWKILNTTLKFKYPKSWISTGEGISNSNIFKKPMPSKQVYISLTGFGAPFEIEEFTRQYPELNHNKILKMAANEDIISTKKYVNKYQGQCKVRSIDDLNVYIVCKYTKDSVDNILYQRTFISDKYLDDKGNATGGIIGLNIKLGSEALKNNKKIITTILESAYIDNIVGNKSLILNKIDLE